MSGLCLFMLGQLVFNVLSCIVDVGITISEDVTFIYHPSDVVKVFLRSLPFCCFGSCCRHCCLHDAVFFIPFDVCFARHSGIVCVYIRVLHCFQSF